MTAQQLSVGGWIIAIVSLVGTAVGWWHHRRDAARVARCAHELRGPLGALRLGLDLALRRGGLTPDRLQALDLQLRRATAALEDLAGAGVAYTRVPVDLVRLLGDCVEAMRPVACARGVPLELETAGRVTVTSDRVRLAQAVSNLIQNAVEHGCGPVRIRMRPGEQTVRVEVLDQGAGLGRPLTRLLRARPDRSRGQSRSAHGHGLAVAASVAAAHGGRLLSAPSERGARLVLELPLHPTAGAAARRGVGGPA